jgi:hypothetical protein
VHRTRRAVRQQYFWMQREMHRELNFRLEKALR